MKAFIETYGCSANQAESETMAGLLSEAGFEISDSMKDSALVIVNTCLVKTATEQKILHRLCGIAKRYPKKKLIIAGCMPEVMADRLRSIAPGAFLVSTHNITRIAEAAEMTLSGKAVEFIGKTKEKKLGKPKLRKNELVGITEISQGCGGRCSYCCVRLAKGSLYCYPPEDIMKDVENALSGWCKEIWLTSQDNAAYIHEGRRLPELIDGICEIAGYFRIRVGMMNPNNLLNIMDSLIETYRNEKVYKFLHVPVQSGSDRILRSMRRNYKVSEFIRIVSNFRKVIPGINIITDVIAGFPGETEEDFQKTVDLLKIIRPDVVNVSKFGARPGTEAEDMAQLDNRLIKTRSSELSGLVRRLALEKNREWVGWSGEILVSERGTGKNQWIGRNIAYKPVLVESRENLLGKRLNVRIEGAELTHLVGSITGPV